MEATKKKITLNTSVDSYRSGWSVVEFLSHRFKYHTPERWTARVESGWVRVNDSEVPPDYRVFKDDVVSYTIFHAEPDVDFRYEVVFEDEHMLAVSKSGNIPVHACGVFIRNTLIAHLKNQLGDHVNLVHRLDRETSGLVLLSKHRDAARELSRMFADGEISKSYRAFVAGRVDRDGEFVVDAPIAKTPMEDMLRTTGSIDEESRTVPDGRGPRFFARREVNFTTGKSAKTVFRVVERYDDYTVLDARPLSGRTNQIRVHLSYIGHAILGDKVYGDAEMLPAPKLCRQALHCQSLSFKHPMTKINVRMDAQLPPDLVQLIA